MMKEEISPTALAKAYERGMSIGALAEQTGLSFSWTRRKILKGGATLRDPESPQPCPIPIEQLAKEYNEGASIMTLADRYDLYYKRVRNLLLENGVTLRPSTRAQK